MRAVLRLQEGDTLFILVGQKGASACANVGNESCSSPQLEPLKNEKNTNKLEVGGGGGGGTYVFKFKPNNREKWIPLLVAGGGGGGSGKLNADFKYSSSK